MKNYELIAKLMNLPAGYEIKFEKLLTAEEHEEHSDIDIVCSVNDIDISDMDEEITFLE